jgi:hypothetical protein
MVDRLPHDSSVHCVLALSLILDKSEAFSVWQQTMPKSSTIFQQMPIMWSPEHQKCLPTASITILKQQQARFACDWAVIQKAFAEISMDKFLHSWLLVNTRCFHHPTLGTKNRPSKDRIVLQPIADLFNHSCHGCDVRFDETGFSIYADRHYMANEEISICYGRHTNDMLLVEYGFSMVDNEWDYVSLDDAIMPLLSLTHQAHLSQSGFLGDYHLDANTMCYRTEVALRLIVLPFQEWKKFVEGDDDGLESEEVTNRLLSQISSGLIHENNHKIQDLKKLPASTINITLLNRWQQISALLQRHQVLNKPGYVSHHPNW